MFFQKLIKEAPISSSITRYFLDKQGYLLEGWLHRILELEENLKLYVTQALLFFLNNGKWCFQEIKLFVQGHTVKD